MRGLLKGAFASLLLIATPAFAEDPVVENRAAAFWTIFNPDEFHDQEARQEELFIDALDIPERNVTEAGRGANLETSFAKRLLGMRERQSFAAKVAKSLVKIQGAKAPELYVGIGAHGDGKVLATKHRELEFEQKAIIATLFDELRRFKGDVSNLKIQLSVTACYSGSLIPLVKEQIEAWEKRTGKILKFQLVTSAPDDQVAHGYNLEEWLTDSARLQKKIRAKGGTACKGCDSMEELGIIFQTLVEANPKSGDKPQVWSSYSKHVNKEPTAEQLSTIAMSVDDIRIKDKLWTRAAEMPDFRNVAVGLLHKGAKDLPWQHAKKVIMGLADPGRTELLMKVALNMENPHWFDIMSDLTMSENAAARIFELLQELSRDEKSFLVLAEWARASKNRGNRLLFGYILDEMARRYWAAAPDLARELRPTLAEIYRLSEIEQRTQHVYWFAFEKMAVNPSHFLQEMEKYERLQNQGNLGDVMKAFFGGLQATIRSPATPPSKRYTMMREVVEWARRQAAETQKPFAYALSSQSTAPLEKFLDVCSDELAAAALDELQQIAALPHQKAAEREERLRELLDLLHHTTLDTKPTVRAALLETGAIINGGQFYNRIQAQLGLPLMPGARMDGIPGNGCVAPKLRVLIEQVRQLVGR